MQVLIKWGLQQRPDCSILCKTTSPERLESNADVFDWSLDEDSMNKLSTLAYQRRMIDGYVWLKPNGPYESLAHLWDEGEEGV